jgi:hypothetical protein
MRCIRYLWLALTVTACDGAGFVGDSDRDAAVRRRNIPQQNTPTTIDTPHTQTNPEPDEKPNLPIDTTNGGSTQEPPKDRCFEDPEWRDWYNRSATWFVACAPEVERLRALINQGSQYGKLDYCNVGAMATRTNGSPRGIITISENYRGPLPFMVKSDMADGVPYRVLSQSPVYVITKASAACASAIYNSNILGPKR